MAVAVRFLTKNDRNTTFLQQVYNSPLTWGGPQHCGAHPM
jgi:hypothetical protein